MNSLERKARAHGVVTLRNDMECRYCKRTGQAVFQVWDRDYFLCWQDAGCERELSPEAKELARRITGPGVELMERAIREADAKRDGS